MLTIKIVDVVGCLGPAHLERHAPIHARAARFLSPRRKYFIRPRAVSALADDRESGLFSYPPVAVSLRPWLDRPHHQRSCSLIFARVLASAKVRPAAARRIGGSAITPSVRTPASARRVTGTYLPDLCEPTATNPDSVPPGRAPERITFHDRRNEAPAACVISRSRAPS